MTRVPELDVTELDERQRAVYRSIAGSRAMERVIGPLNIWLRNPELAETAQRLGAYCRFGTKLPTRLSELAILVIAVHWQADFEWWAHRPIAVGAGLDPALLDRLAAGDPVRFETPDEQVVYEFTRELLQNQKVSDSLFERGRAILGLDGVIDLTGILGYYTLIAMTVKVFEIAIPTGE